MAQVGAGSTPSGSQEQPRLTRPRVVVQELLDKAIIRGTEIRSRSSAKQNDVVSLREEFFSWEAYNQELFKGTFTELPAVYPADFDREDFSHSPTWSGDLSRVHLGVDERLRALMSIRDLLDLYQEPSEAIRAGGEHPAPKTTTSVFIVHGHKDAPKQELARFIQSATNSNPIILHEQTTRGRTIIEALEKWAATAAFAIVLLTGDDEGGVRGSGSYQPRSRQNVVFELGFYIGALGRGRVAVLYEDGVELPSDLSGVIYIALDPAGAWKLRVSQELYDAGLPIDLRRPV